MHSYNAYTNNKNISTGISILYVVLDILSPLVVTTVLVLVTMETDTQPAPMTTHTSVHMHQMSCGVRNIC